MIFIDYLIIIHTFGHFINQSSCGTLVDYEIKDNNIY